MDDSLKRLDFMVGSNVIGVHQDEQNNTQGVIDVNTRSVVAIRQNPPMARNGGKTSEFWERLVEARRTHKPALPTTQESIAQELDVWQTAVSKWKTGGDDGKAKPEPEKVELLAARAQVSFEWLYWGKGEMRPAPPIDPVAREVIERMSTLLSHDAKVQVLKAAVAQQELERPEVAARLRNAQKEAERKVSVKPKKTV
jgi:transcriptional regulator with XRE-family HTH domain